MTLDSPATLKQMVSTKDNLAVQHDPEIAELASTIDYHSPMTIQSFGSEVAENAAHYTDKILDSAKAIDLDSTGAELNRIVLTAQEFDLDSLPNRHSDSPLIGGLIRRFSMTKEKAVARFATVREQVDKLVANIESTAQSLNQRSEDFQVMYDGIRSEYDSLGRHIAAIQLRLDDLEQEIASVDDSDDLASSERAAILEAARNQLSKRADDLMVVRHSTMQMLPMVRIIQSNNITLVDKFQTIRNLTLPAWKRTFMLLLTLDEQKSAVELSTTIDNATNTMMRRSAELLHQNSVGIAQTNQRLVVDVETLRDVHDKIIATLTDVRNEHKKGAEQRGEAIAELEHLRTNLSAEVKGIGSNEI
ncbi:MAG: toxic anion resistance protein [Pseudomonadota bacterium]